MSTCASVINEDFTMALRFVVAALHLCVHAVNAAPQSPHQSAPGAAWVRGTAVTVSVDSEFKYTVRGLGANAFAGDLSITCGSKRWSLSNKTLVPQGGGPATSSSTDMAGPFDEVTRTRMGN